MLQPRARYRCPLDLQISLEIIREADLDTGAGAGWEATSKHAESEREVISRGVTTSYLSF